MNKSPNLEPCQQVSVYENVDFHTHSTASDGALTPTELIEKAATAGIQSIALTDHDSTSGLEEARTAAEQYGIQLINGIEISVTWEKRCFHIVGLNIDPTYMPLQEGLKEITTKRIERAQAMSDRLVKHGLPETYHGALALAGENGMLTRTHFAKYLVDEGIVTDANQAFDKYLKQGKPGFVNIEWASLEEALMWINQSGGVAVLAHPMRYKLTGSWLRRFLTAFKTLGGQGIEIVTGNGTAESINLSASYAKSFDLLGSIGSDFHTPEARWISFGSLPKLPKDIRPVWHQWLPAANES